jgi:hypothetical protein
MRRNGSSERGGVRSRATRAGRPRLELLETRELLAVVVNLNDTGAGSLRQAIIDTNTDPNDNIITFNIPGSGVHIIPVLSQLPEITSPVTIDGTTQPGTGATPTIEINGTDAGAGTAGLIVSGGGTTIRGLAINRFQGQGIVLKTLGGNRVEANFIGVDPSGTQVRPNTGDGVFIDNVASNTIGGTTTAVRNVIGGNTGNGIHIAGIAATANVVQGNVIGTNTGATLNLGNDGDGVRINAGSSNSIGGSVAAAANTIAFNDLAGVHVLSGDGNGIRRNSMFGNGGLGIELDPGANDDIPTPEVTLAVTSGTTTTVNGTFTATPNTAYTVELFSALVTDTPTTAEGRTFVGTTTLTTNASGVGTFSMTTTGTVPVGQFIVATITDPSNNTSEFSVPRTVIAPTANLAMVGSATPNPVAVNGFLTYTFVAGNQGPTPGTLTFTNNLPTGVSFVSATSTQGNVTRTGNTVTVTLGTVNAGQTATITITVVPTVANASLSNTATLTAPEDATPVSVTVTTNAQAGINLFAQAAASPNPVDVGSTFVVTYTVTNTGQATSTVTSLKGNTPAGATLISVTPSQGFSAIDPGGGFFGVNFQSLAPNASGLVQAVYRANVTGTLTATANAFGVEPEINPPDNTTSIAVTSQNAVTPIPPDTTPPLVTNLSRFGARRQPTDILLLFDEAMSQTTVEDTANYTLVTAGADGRFNTRDDVRLPIDQATYQPASFGVVLRPRRRIPLGTRVQITVNGSTPTGVADVTGSLLDGVGDGLPGSNFVRVFRGFGPGPISYSATARQARARR